MDVLAQHSLFAIRCTHIASPVLATNSRPSGPNITIAAPLSSLKTCFPRRIWWIRCGDVGEKTVPSRSTADPVSDGLADQIQSLRD